MATNHDLPATDSAAVLHELVGDDATAAFENDPKFVDGTGTESASSENLQTRADRQDIQGKPSLEAAADDEDEEDEDDEDLDDEDDEEDDLDEDEDDEDLDDEDDEDDEDDDLDDDDDEEDEDDEDEE